MVIGNGLLAKGFKRYADNDEIIIFASGVSNSSSISKSDFSREEVLLKKYLKSEKNKLFIYFGTCSIYDKYPINPLYIEHKLRMEELVKAEHVHYLIFRLSQVLGQNNKSQLVRFLVDRIKDNKKFDLYDIERNLIDIDDVEKIITYIIVDKKFSNVSLNIANPFNVKVTELVRLIEKMTNLKASYDLIQKVGDLSINIEDIKPLIKELGIFSEDYVERCLMKYYAS